MSSSDGGGVAIGDRNMRTCWREPGAKPFRLTILGATGSIGTSTLDLVSEAPDAFELVAVTADRNADALAAIARKFGAKRAIVADPSAYATLKSALAGTSVEAAAGADEIVAAAAMPADCVMAAIMGAAGLRASLEAIGCGTRLALANKECLVSAGPVFMEALARSSAELLPVDSEHSAIHQSLVGHSRAGVEKVTVTASGGPFRTWSAEAMAAAGPEQALKHPNWSMGAKISIDSATMMNKGLELIEARFLFDLSPDQLDVVVHPQSIIHSLVSYIDGSVVAQLGVPDMRTPIAYALAYPNRMPASIERLDLARLGQLTFEPPDERRFPALAIAKAAMRRGAAAPAILNAANEIAVAAFLARRLKFGHIATLVERVLERAEGSGLIGTLVSVEDVLAADRAGRQLARDVMATM